MRCEKTTAFQTCCEKKAYEARAGIALALQIHQQDEYMTFEELHLIRPLLKAVADAGYQQPTPIQQKTVLHVLDGRDVLGCAQTGTGKTAAFALPILQRLSETPLPKGSKRPIRALVLTPTRELALQIFENFVQYGKQLPLRSCVIFGGVGQQPQVEALKRGVDILVATPGRLNDLIGQGFIMLDQLQIFVLDEADRMLDMGFIHDVKKVISRLPKQRQTLLFSATMPAEVEKLALSILLNPVEVKVDPVSSTVDTIDQSLYLIDKVNKKLLLRKLLSEPQVESALVFTRTKHGADRVVRELSRGGIDARAIHGDKSQGARQQALGDFKSGKVRVLVATDIAARGIDIAGLSHVFNYDLPNEPESYVHRIGRTGRAGLNGTAVSFCCIDEMKELKQIEKLIGKAIPRKESPWPMEVFTETVKTPRGTRTARLAEGQPEKPELKPKKSPALPARELKQDAVRKKPFETTASSTSGGRKKAIPATGAATPSPAMRATPLTRPAHVVQPVRESRPADPAKVESLPSYTDLLRSSRRKQRRTPLSTGNDRR